MTVKSIDLLIIHLHVIILLLGNLKVQPLNRNEKASGADLWVFSRQPRGKFQPRLVLLITF